jgi:hypothetical protein
MRHKIRRCLTCCDEIDTGLFCSRCASSRPRKRKRENAKPQPKQPNLSTG